jgi:flagellar hook assembly protein FlgD
MKEASSAELQILDLRGIVVRTLFIGKVERGSYFVKWDGKGSSGKVLPAGIYYSRLSSEHSTQVKRMVIIR